MHGTLILINLAGSWNDVILVNNTDAQWLPLTDEIDQRPYTCSLANMATKLTNIYEPFHREKEIKNLIPFEKESFS